MYLSQYWLLYNMHLLRLFLLALPRGSYGTSSISCHPDIASCHWYYRTIFFYLRTSKIWHVQNKANIKQGLLLSVMVLKASWQVSELMYLIISNLPCRFQCSRLCTVEMFYKFFPCALISSKLYCLTAQSKNALNGSVYN